MSIMDKVVQDACELMKTDRLNVSMMNMSIST